jgi:hypothetical protein
VVYIEMVMTAVDANGLSMYLALQDFYPMVNPSMEFVGNIFRAFEAEQYTHSYVPAGKWTEDLQQWLPINTGLIRDPADVNWDKFRVVDEKLYSFALLKYS